MKFKTNKNKEILNNNTVFFPFRLSSLFFYFLSFLRPYFYNSSFLILFRLPCCCYFLCPSRPLGRAICRLPPISKHPWWSRYLVKTSLIAHNPPQRIRTPRPIRSRLSKSSCPYPLGHRESLIGIINIILALGVIFVLFNWHFLSLRIFIVIFSFFSVL